MERRWVIWLCLLCAFLSFTALLSFCALQNDSDAENWINWAVVRFVAGVEGTVLAFFALINWLA